MHDLAKNFARGKYWMKLGRATDEERAVQSRALGLICLPTLRPNEHGPVRQWTGPAIFSDVSGGDQAGRTAPVATTGPVGWPVGDPPGGSSDTASTALASMCAMISGDNVIDAG